jgi:hypothetical protein
MAGLWWAAAMVMYSSGMQAPRRKLKAERAWSSMYAGEDIAGWFCFIFAQAARAASLRGLK